MGNVDQMYHIHANSDFLNFPSLHGWQDILLQDYLNTLENNGFGCKWAATGMETSSFETKQPSIYFRVFKSSCNKLSRQPHRLKFSVLILFLYT